jgi:hypothetical protein
VNGTPFDLGLPFFVAFFISYGAGSLRSPVVWLNISFRASEVNSGTQTGLRPSASCGGGEWCVDVYRARDRWLARAYRRGEHARGPKPGTRYRQRRGQRRGGSPESGTGGTSPGAAPE